MRKIFNLAACASIALLSACQTKENLSVLITNGEEHDRSAELVELKRTDLKGFSEEPFKLLLKGQELPYQLVDTDLDGQWDLLLTVVSVAASATDTLLFEKTATTPVYPNTTQVRHRKLLTDRTFGAELKKDTMILGLEATDFSKEKLPPYLTEGPAWENDLVGFRLYFDKRNGRDIWGKLTPELVLSEVGTDTTVSYHNLQPWGMDILKVGGSLGAGAVGFSYKDSLYRLAGDQFESVTYEELYDGPIQAAFKMVYKGFRVRPDLEPIDVEELITITKGQWYYNNKVTIKNAPGELMLITGIVNLHEVEFKYLEIDHYISMYSYGIQSENKDGLGMALLVDKKNFGSFATAPKTGSGIVNTHLIKMPILKEGNEFKFLSMWSKSLPEMTDDVNFVDLLNTVTYNLVKPLAVKVN
jgi:hypothetical protein